MYCTSCGQPMQKEAELCVKCGVRQYRLHNYCSECGALVSEVQDVCLKCGTSVKQLTTPNPNVQLEPWLAVLVSLFVPGLAQMLLGQIQKGIVILAGVFIISIFTFGIGGFILNIVNIIDAYKIAEKKQAGIPVDEWEFF